MTTTAYRSWDVRMTSISRGNMGPNCYPQEDATQTSVLPHQELVLRKLSALCVHAPQGIEQAESPALSRQDCAEQPSCDRLSQPSSLPPRPQNSQGLHAMAHSEFRTLCSRGSVPLARSAEDEAQLRHPVEPRFHVEGYSQPNSPTSPSDCGNEQSTFRGFPSGATAGFSTRPIHCSASFPVGSLSSINSSGGAQGFWLLSGPPTPEGQQSYSPSSSLSLSGSLDDSSVLSGDGGTSGLDAGDMEAESAMRVAPLPEKKSLSRCKGSSGSLIGSKQGLSSFFGGKSRSFTCLGDVAGIGSIQELAKPANPYARRKQCNSQNMLRTRDARISKKSTGCGSLPSAANRSSLAVAVAMGAINTSMFSCGVAAGKGIAPLMAPLAEEGPTEEVENP